MCINGLEFFEWLQYMLNFLAVGVLFKLMEDCIFLEPYLEFFLLENHFNSSIALLDIAAFSASFWEYMCLWV